MNYTDELRCEAEDLGFAMVRRTKHQWLYKDAHGSRVGIATTSSSPSAYRNTLAALRRAVALRDAQAPKHLTINPKPRPVSGDQSMSAAHNVQPSGQTKVCTKCGVQKPEEAFPVNHLPNVPKGTRYSFCSTCRVKRKVPKAPKVADAPAKPSTPLVQPVQSPAITARLSRREEAKAKLATAFPEDEIAKAVAVEKAADDKFKDDANRALPKTKVNLPKALKAQPSTLPEGLPNNKEPEQMAMRVLIRRYQAEYDQLLLDMMTALGWDS